MKQYYQRVLEPYRLRMSSQLGLPPDQKLVVLHDCWSVHQKASFLKWVKETFPHIIVLFIPAGTTSIAQPADVILNRPIKHMMKHKYVPFSFGKAKYQGGGKAPVKDSK